jgi:diguanylate cyclase (GGDEF)-like protein
LKRNLFFLLVLLSVTLTFADTTKKHIKVGYVPIQGMQNIESDGSFSGYLYDFYSQLSVNADWEIEFVVGSWKDSLKKLERGEIDILGLIPKVEPFSSKFLFPEINAGLTNIAIYGLENINYPPLSDFFSEKTCTIGLIESGISESALDRFVRENSYTIQKKYYGNQNELYRALEKGEVDLFIAACFTNILGTQALEIVPPIPFYFATSKKSPAVFSELNIALEKIHLFYPVYTQTLYSKYFVNSTLEYLNLNQAERRYIKEHPVVDIVYDPSWFPMEYFNTESGKYSGVLKYFFEDIASFSGLKFNFIATKTYTESLELIKNNKAQMITCFEQDFQWADEMGIKLTKPYIVLSVDNIFNPKTENNKIALLYNNISPKVVEKLSKVREIVFYDSYEQCLEAVHKGEARETYLNSFSSNYLRNNPKYNQLIVTHMDTHKIPISMGISSEAPTELLTIFEKILAALPSDHINNYLLTVGSEIPKLTVIEWLQLNLKTTIIIILSVSVVILFILLLYMIEHKHRYKLINFNDITGLWNGSKFSFEVEKKIRKEKEQFAIIELNISRFRFVNDSFNRKVGNKVLKLFADQLINNFARKNEIYGTIWADYFIVLVYYNTPEEIEERINDFARHFQEKASSVCSFRFVLKAGIAFYNPLSPNPPSVEDLIEQANHAMSTIRDPYKTQCRFFNETMETEIENLRIVDIDMMESFKRGEFQPFFQPKYDINTGRICGAEALIRWVHPVKGIIPPDQFLPYFEKSGFIIDIDYLVFEKTCQFLNSLQQQGKQLVPISCNFSRLHAKNEDFPEKVQAISLKYNIPPHLLEIEITETIAMEKMDTILRHFKKFREMGFLISIDDFGSGYSSLTILEQLDIDVIKLDKAFLKSTQTTPREYQILQAIISLAQKLGLTVICEGVETSQHVMVLKQAGCSKAQGYFYAKPLPEDMFREAIDRRYLDDPLLPQDGEIAIDEEILEELDDISIPIIAPDEF